jgi:hypothetical protein
LRGAAEFAIVHRRRGNAADPYNCASDEQASTDRVDGCRIAPTRIARRGVLFAAGCFRQSLGSRIRSLRLDLVFRHEKLPDLSFRHIGHVWEMVP